MGIIRTDRWLDQWFFQPEIICEKLMNHFDRLTGQSIYLFLQSKGMYKPNRLTKKNFHMMKERNHWEKVEDFFNKYKKRWKGPNISIYVFPSSFSLFDPMNKREGFTFPHAMFLFLSPNLNDRELEALFVHEYHHATRMGTLKKPVSENNLADSVVMEGLAEFAVWKYCGEPYLSKWIFAYEEKEIKYVWKKWFQPNLTTSISDPLHDQLLYGKIFSKPMFGYAAGFYFVKQFDQQSKLSMEESFILPANTFILRNENQGK
ncbi:DUF2268 domain-containing protein [Fervidibacillus halotolerans]|uniref:DUF2268 domain-containing protein n=1 Tax=Fervidibacillus halotolerans TaxID=2980027 RepID=A0A9E8M083_9BACI|nr:DUF2268 domain-containing putative Zn-dependent protease [Fervidibacillus halotolerans]WAA13063.1 DUF2268 domain-containing protein [Fervidibacillus halotolerans]